MNIIDAIHSKDLFRPCFRDLKTWESWLTVLKALFALPMTKADLKLYRASTGRKKPPSEPLKELWAVIGRRGGKSYISAITAVYLALFYDYDKYLSPGEVGTIQIVAADRSQAKVIFRYIQGVLNSNPIFQQYIVKELSESIELTNRITIETMTCSYRGIRGRTVVASIFDEIAFWQTEGLNPDKEVLAAVRPSMATIPTSKLIVISSPYARHGVLYDAFSDFYGKDDVTDILIWRAPTRVMNPTIDQKLIDRETEKDPSAAQAEWQAMFREDIEQFLTLEAIEACCVLDGTLAHDRRYNYFAFADPSGGRADAFTLAIGYSNEDKLTTALLRAWEPPFVPETVVSEICEVLNDYGINRVVGDRYAAAWVSSAFEKHSIQYEACDKNKSDLYLNLEGQINTKNIELPNNKKLITELRALERRRGKSGKDNIDHPPRGHDDRANSVAGLSYEGLKGVFGPFSNLIS